ncbi:MAG: hypothetical protein GX216_05420 [Methanomicrobiales archaeon]|nr:hypothetical protein [Methanomicrobiales archaeon]
MAEEMYAFSRIEGAVHRTKALLWPFEWGVWLRLVIIALFVSGGISIPNTFQYRFDGSDFATGAIGFTPAGVATIMLVILAVVLVVALIWAFIGATMRFVFVDMLSTGDIHIRRFFRERLGKGVRLFIFEIVLTAAMLIAMVASALLLFGFWGTHTATPLLLIALIPLILVAAILFGLVFLLTTDFVVPIMVSEDCGVIAGWRRLIGVISSQLWQTIVYVITRFVLGLVAAIAQMILVIIALLVIAIPFVLIGIVFLAILQGRNLILLLALGVPYLIIAIPVTLLIAVPFVTFFRYYTLLVLEGLRPEYRLLPE